MKTYKLSNPEVQALLRGLVGDDGIAVLRALEGRIATAEELAEETGLPMHRVRAVLNILNTWKLTEYLRRGTGRMEFTYLWRFNPQKLPDFVNMRERARLEELRRQLEYEEGNAFYTCSEDKTRVPFDEAFELEFRCPKCRGVLAYIDNRQVVEGIKAKVERLEELAAEG